MDSTIRKFLAIDIGQRNHAPQDTNGVIVPIDFSTTVTFCLSQNRSVINQNGGLDLRRSIARAMYILAGSPEVPPAVDASSALAARNSISVHYLRYNLLTVITHSDIANEIALRKGDIITASVYESIPGVVRDAYENAADAVHMALVEDEHFAAQFIPSPLYASLCLVANAIHREQVSGHNWFSDTNPKSNTVGGKVLSVAGGEVNEFADFMSTYGHDLWHIFTDNCLYAIARAITGFEHKTLLVQVTYASTVYEGGSAIEDLFHLDSAAKDRYPPQALGRSAVILGAKVMRYTITDLMTRAPDDAEACKAILTSLGNYAALVGSNEFTRADAQVVKKVLGLTFAFCYGYAMVFNDAVELFEKNKSLKAWADLESGEYIIGSNVGKWAKGVEKDNGVISQMVLAFLESMTAALARLPGAINEGRAAVAPEAEVTAPAHGE